MVLLKIHAEYAFEQFDYNEKRLYNKIEKFLNHPKRVITQVQETTYDEIEDKIIDLKRYMYG